MSFTPHSTAPAANPGGRCANLHEIEPNLAGTGLRVGIVMARFNRDIGEGLLSAAARNWGDSASRRVT